MFGSTARNRIWFFVVSIAQAAQTQALAQAGRIEYWCWESLPERGHISQSINPVM